ncbi:MAG: DUF5615 family PIN-like protein [Verrucomicrobiota bacterium]
MKFLVDAQLPPALARWLSEAGHEAFAVREVGLREAEDLAIFDYALRNGLVILTKDEDFAMLAEGGEPSPTIVWLRIGNCSNDELQAWLMHRLEGIVELVQHGGVIQVI